MTQISLTLYEKLRRAVHQYWDPIGIMAYEDDMGEYDGYLPGLIQVLMGNPSQDEIFNYLWEIETVSIGLSGNRENTKNFSEFLHKFKSDFQDG